MTVEAYRQALGFHRLHVAIQEGSAHVINGVASRVKQFGFWLKAQGMEARGIAHAMKKDADNKMEQMAKNSATDALMVLNDPSMRFSWLRNKYMEKFQPDQYLAEGREAFAQLATGIGQAARATVQHMKPVGTVADHAAATCLGKLMSKVSTAAKLLRSIQVISATAVSTAIGSIGAFGGLVALGYGSYKATLFVLEGGLQRRAHQAI